MKKILTSLFILLLSSSCQQKSGAPNGEAVPVGPATVVTPDEIPSNPMGGGDTVGGGTTINKKPLEAYAKKVVNMKVYQSQVMPLIEKMKSKNPRLAADFMHLTHRRVWYFIPTSLDQISSKIVGTYARTEQAALQDLNAIWFDSNIFNEMSEEDQGILLVHELVMGTKLLNFKTRQDQCFAKAALQLLKDDEKRNELYDAELKYCRETYRLGEDLGSRKFSLTSDDYSNIRKLVIELIQEDPNWSEVKTLMEEHIRRHQD